MEAKREYHTILKGTSVADVLEKERAFLEEHPGASPLIKRWFLSSPEAQQAEIPHAGGAVSVIGQSPLDASAAALWIWCAEGMDIEYRPGITIAKADGLEHWFRANMTAPGCTSADQTDGILREYEEFLVSNGMDIEKNCVRTWFFCNDIDNNYAGLVKARRENFELHGLTAGTHYIASTGIAGVPYDGSIVQMDAWAVKGRLVQRYLYAPTHLNPTSEYGVTFERGVRLDWGGKSHCIISGTASIDNKGAVLHTGDAAAQTRRMLENVGKLLEEGGAGFGDIRSASVYLRNASDYKAVNDILATALEAVPYVVTLAPVCRPAWLVEMECIAIV